MMFRSLRSAFAKATAIAAAFAAGQLALANPPTTYTADSGTEQVPKPAITSGGMLDLSGTISGGVWTPHVAGHGAGYNFTPTDFYCPILRLTDPNTTSLTTYSYLSASTWMGRTWNYNSTRFHISRSGGSDMVYNFNASTFTATPLNTTLYSGLGDWAGNDAAICYGQTGSQIVSWNFNVKPPTSSLIVDVSQYITGVGNLYETHASDGGSHGGSGTVAFASACGGGQDTCHYAVYYKGANGYIYDTYGDGVTGGKITTLTGTVVASGITPMFHLHQIAISADGGYVWLAVGGTSVGDVSGAPFIWNISNQTVLAVGAAGASSKIGGHTCVGFGEQVNGVSDTSGTYWWYRQIDSATHIASPASLVSTPSGFFGNYDNHPCWANAQGGSVQADWIPFLTGIILHPGTTDSDAPWGDEVVAVATANRTGTANTVWRFAHHRSTIQHYTTPDSSGNYDDYNANAWVQISQDGLWGMFQSDWEETLGIDGTGHTYRTDVFIVKLAESAH